MGWTYVYRGIDDAGLDSGCSVAERLRFNAETERMSKKSYKSVVGKWNDKDKPSPITGWFDEDETIPIYANIFKGCGIYNGKCYIVVSILGEIHNVYIPKNHEWLYTAIQKKGDDK